MAAEDVYRKTEKGRTEIATRVNKLGMRERTLLIMVDDKTSRSGLLARGAHPSSGDILDALVAQGFIEIASAAGSPVSEPAASGGASATAAAVEVSLTSASRHACRALVSYLGPAADDLTALIEKSKGAAELGTTLEKCRQIIQSLAGKQKADEFWAGVSARLPRA